MTRIKLCGLSRESDIETANDVQPDYIGFVFAQKSRRYVSFEKAAMLKEKLDPAIQAAGVFVNETPETVSMLLSKGIIDIAQLHGDEDDEYIAHLKQLTDKPIIRAYRIQSLDDIRKAEQSAADMILLDSGAGTGQVFDWNLLREIRRPYFLAGGLDQNNAADAIRALHPFALDVSSGIETDGVKDKSKMAAFAAAVRKADKT